MGWRQEHIYFLYLPVFTSEALRQTAKPWRAGSRSTFPSQSLFPAPTRSALKIRSGVSNADAIKCLLYSRAWIRAVAEPQTLHLLIRVQLPLREPNRVKSHYPASCKPYNSLGPAVLVLLQLLLQHVQTAIFKIFNFFFKSHTLEPNCCGFIICLHYMCSACLYVPIYVYDYINEYFLEHKLSVLSPVRPLRAACATSPGAGCLLCVLSQCMVSLEKKWINFIWLSNHAFTLKTILISRLKIFPFRFAVGITWRSETLYTQECSASPLQDFSMPSSVTGQLSDRVSCYCSTGTASGCLHKGYVWSLAFASLPLFSWSQGTSCALFLLQSPFCTWPEKPQRDGRRPAGVQFVSPKTDTTVKFC